MQMMKAWEEIKNKKIEFYAESNRIVNKNKTVKNQRVYYYSGIILFTRCKLY